MKDVARHVGVSMMTVSRVLNNETSVRAATRAKVLAAVNELGYRPNISARSLAASKSYFLGLIYDNPSSAYLSELLIGALKTCRSAGYHLVVESCGEAPDLWVEEVLERVKDSNLDGVVVPPPVCDDRRVLEALQRNGIPHVRMSPGQNAQGSPAVFMDDRRASAEITRHLIKHGHREIGFIVGHPNQESSRLRHAGFCDAMAEHGFEIDVERVVQGYYSYKSGFSAAERLLSAAAPPSAIFASNDDMAAAVYAAAQKHNLRIPDQLSVVGFDDTPTASILWPALTTIRQPISDLASAAIALLVDCINKSNGETPSRELAFELVSRESVAVCTAAEQVV